VINLESKAKVRPPSLLLPTRSAGFLAPGLASGEGVSRAIAFQKKILNLVWVGAY
jgi:hypothetical protein